MVVSLMDIVKIEEIVKYRGLNLQGPLYLQSQGTYTWKIDLVTFKENFNVQ